MSKDLKAKPKPKFKVQQQVRICINQPEKDSQAWAHGRIGRVTSVAASANTRVPMYIVDLGTRGEFTAYEEELSELPPPFTADMPSPPPAPKAQPEVTLRDVVDALNKTAKLWKELLRHAALDDIEFEATRRKRIADAKAELDRTTHELAMAEQILSDTRARQTNSQIALSEAESK
jgi:hypothetical protein